MKAIKHRTELPIKPTAKPTPEEILTVAGHLVSVTQSSLLSPSAVVSAIRCALDVYAQNLINQGFDPKIVEQCEALGQAMAKVVVESKKTKAPLSSGGGLLDANGNAIQSAPPDEEPAEVSESTGNP